MRVLFPELVLKAGWSRGSCLAQGRTFQGKKTDSSQPVTNSPECEGVKGRASASSDSLVMCCCSGNGLLLITLIVSGEMSFFTFIKSSQGVLRNNLLLRE